MFWDFLFPHNEIFEIDFLLSIGLQDQIAAHNKKKCTKHNICWNQTEIEKGPTKKKKTNKQTTELKNMKAVIGV